jgi:site-specific DNA-methyltransferase (adenine-specific)
MIPFPNKKYQVIYADPPWKYSSRINLKTKFGGGAYGHYELMSIPEIKNLPVQSIIDTNCILFLWVTFPFLKDQLEVFEAWGFKYKTVAFTWVKLNSKNMKPFFGIGYYTKSNAEICLLGTRGKVIKPATNKVSSMIFAPRRERSYQFNQLQIKIALCFFGRQCLAYPKELI